MQMRLFIGGIFAAGTALAAMACSSAETTGNPEDDGTGGETNASSSGGSSSGGASSSSGGSSGGGSSSSSGGSSSGGIASKELVQGFSTLTGIAGDQVVYQAIGAGGVTLNAVPIAGGTPTKIADMAQGDRAIVRGGAVGIWKTVTSGIGTFSVWTKASGLKEGPTDSLVGLFTANADGTRIAFSVAATATTSRLAVVAPTDVTSTTTYNGGANAAINIANTCLPFLRFAGSTFVGAYCTAGSAVRARLVVMPAGETDFDSVVSNTTNASGIQPYFQISKNDAKVLVLGLPDTEAGVTADEQLRIVTLADGAVQVIDTDVYDGVLTDDGSAVVYQTGAGGLKRAATGASPSPVEILPAGAIKEVLGYTNDRSRVFFASTDPDQNGLVDVKTATTAAANAAADVAAGVQPLGLNADDSHFLWFAGDATSASLKAKPAAGGADKELFKDPEIGLVPPTGAGVVVGHAGKEITIGSVDASVYSLSAVTMAGAATPIATDVIEGGWTFKDKTLVYAKVVLSGGVPGAGSGLFSATLP